MVQEIPCYLRGTHIRTPGGETRIEDLGIGDPVITISGAAPPIKWIGRRRHARRSAAWVRQVRPVRIGRFALDDRTAHRDLYVSPNHALLIDGVLFPARLLVNGTSVARTTPDGDMIEYFHLELDAHDAIFAEGAAAETYLDWDNREMFANFAEHARLYPDAGATRPTPCAPYIGDPLTRAQVLARIRAGRDPRIDAPKLLAEIRARLDQRARALAG